MLVKKVFPYKGNTSSSATYVKYKKLTVLLVPEYHDSASFSYSSVYKGKCDIVIVFNGDSKMLNKIRNAIRPIYLINVRDGNDYHFTKNENIIQTNGKDFRYSFQKNSKGVAKVIF